MKTIIIAPDSFKGTVDAVGACRAMEQGVKFSVPECSVISLPVADGGEGTVDCFLRALDCKKVNVSVTGPFYAEKVTAAYARDGETAIIEMASAAGLPLAEGRLDPKSATTYGVGELIAHAVHQGAGKIVLGLGGSCTNDCGVGMAQALGTVFYDREGKEFRPSGDTLEQIGSFDCTATVKLLKGVTVTAMCDITNPLYGPRGAAYVFAPQKGADEETAALLDRNLRGLAEVIRKQTGMDVQAIGGSGAAGGMGAGVAAFLGCSLPPGIDQVVELVGFDKKLERADLVLTGEGRMDSQSLGGKVVSGIGRRAKEKGVPVVAIVGAIGEDLDLDAAKEAGISAVFSINPAPVDFEIARHKTSENLTLTVQNIINLIQAVAK